MGFFWQKETGAERIAMETALRVSFQEHYFNISRYIVCSVFSTFSLQTIWRHHWSNLHNRKTFQKEKHHSSIFWKTFQISTNYFSLHRHFKGDSTSHFPSPSPLNTCHAAILWQQSASPKDKMQWLWLGFKLGQFNFESSMLLWSIMLKLMILASITECNNVGLQWQWENLSLHAGFETFTTVTDLLLCCGSYKQQENSPILYIKSPSRMLRHSRC